MLRTNIRSPSTVDRKTNSTIAIKKSAPATAKKPLASTLNTSKSTVSTINSASSNIPKPKQVLDAKNSKVDPSKKFSLRRPSKTSLGVKIEPKPRDPLPTKPHTARPSNVKTVLSRPSTTASSVSRQSVPLPGKLPTYLKRMNSQTQGPNKLKIFNALKTKLRDAQSEFFKALESLKENQPVSDGSREEYKFVALVKNGDGKLIVNSTENVPRIEGGLENKSFLSIKEKLASMKEEITSVTSAINFEIRVLQQSSGLECGDVEKTQSNFSTLLKKLEEFTEANKSQAIEVERFLNEVADNSRTIIREIDNQELESKLHATTQDLECHKRKLELVESKLSELKSKEQLNNIESKSKDKQLQVKEDELAKLKADLKTLEDQKHKNTTEASKLKLKVRNLEVELNEYKEKVARNASAAEEVITLRSEFELAEKRNTDLQELYQKEATNAVKLQTEIKEKDNELTKTVDDLEKLKVLEDGSNKMESELMKEIRTLKFEKDDLIEERNQLEKDKRLIIKDFKANSVEIQVKYNEVLDQLKAMESLNSTLKNKLTAIEEALKTKTQQIAELKAYNDELTNSTRAKEIQNELIHLRENDIAKNHEIHHLKIDLAKVRHDVRQKEEELMLHQRVLKVRSELIDSMQQKEKSSESKICDLLAEIGKQSNHINQINFELATKSEELQNLFSALGTKQIEISRQEHMIKMLEENNERNEEIKASQAKRIEQLENDIIKLKDSVKVYEKHLLVINESNRNYLMNENRNSRESFGNSSNDYENERRRKRKLEIAKHKE